MLGLLKLFKANGFQELTTVGQILYAVEQNFIKDKFVDGEAGRDALIDSVIAELQSLKSTASTTCSSNCT
jgi:hypothetical protein